MNKITLSGNAGTGKTTIGRILASHLNYEFISIGNFTREFARTQFNVNINEFQVKCNNDPEIDDLIDNGFKELCNNKNYLIADYRLGFYFIKGAFNVLLTVSDEVAYQRINNANRLDEIINREEICNRNLIMKQRFLNKYGIDYTNVLNYNLVVNTENYSPIEISELIISNFYFHENAHSNRSCIV